MPIKKELMMFIMLLPICIQQMGSFSYDMMLNCFSFLFIANIFYFKFEKQCVTIKDLLLLTIILVIIALIKIPYVLLGMLVFFIPKEKIVLLNMINSKIKNKKVVNVFLIIISLIILIFLFFKIAINISYVKVLIAFFINPIDGILLIIRTIINYIDFYAISIVGYFGWHDTPVSIVFGFFVIICMLVINFLSSHDNQKNRLKSKERISMFSFGIIFSIIIIISLFDWSIQYLGVNTLSFSIKDYSDYISLMDSILGVQGRYFIPIIPLLLIPIDFDIKIKNKKTLLTITQIIYYVIMFIYIFVIIIKRYWI